jgi:hypothetical protein
MRTLGPIAYFHEFHNTSAIIQLGSEQRVFLKCILSDGPNVTGKEVDANLCSESSWMIADVL